MAERGACPRSGRVEDFDPDQIDRALDVNLRAPIQLHPRASPPEQPARTLGIDSTPSFLIGRTGGAAQRFQPSSSARALRAARSAGARRMTRAIAGLR